MCGINGFNFSDKNLISKMNESTKHRGPDGTGCFVNDSLSFGHNLLAITEVAENSKQPFISEDGNYVLIFNGEIYNYQELRDQLKSFGDNFLTNSDTEVLFKGLIRFGESFISKLDGMFAFAFYNKLKNIVFLSRDSSGIKPLYYYFDGKKIIFSSEIRALLVHNIDRQLDFEAFNIYMLLGYVPGYKTLIKNIFKLCPGQLLQVNLSDGLITKSWFDLGDRYEKNITYLPEVLRSKMHDAVNKHTQGLRPLGLYLSGGLDSSLVYYELFKSFGKNLKTFTTRFDVNDNYFNQDADVAKRLTSEYGTNHFELLITENNFVDSIEDMINCIEEPRWNPHITNQWLLAKEASKEVVVVMNGSGGDELFLGYGKHLNSRRIHSYYSKYPKFFLDLVYTIYAFKTGRINKFNYLPLSNLVYRWAYINNVSFNLSKHKFNFLKDFDVTNLAKYLISIGAPPITSMLPDEENVLGDLDRFFWLADEEFLRTDKITMHFSMEGRFPILAKAVQRYANSIPSNEKIMGNVTKRIIRDAYKGYLPDYIINKEKTGWKSPVTIWMNSKLGEVVKSTLSPEYYQGTKELFNFGNIHKIIAKNDKYKIATLKQFMPIFSFQVWARKFNLKI